ncbi:MAG: response regulator transcription factor [Cyclobacteriaceae bacterium]|nr:MAG: response regulator transcription factor [Cyclobacteriaceae bacterium]
MGSSIRVLVVDDQAMVAESLAALVKTFGSEIKTYFAVTAQEALRIISTSSIAVAFIDARMPGTSGIELIKALREDYYPLKIVGITSYAQPETVAEILQSGVDGLLLKSSATSEALKLCLTTVLAGNRFISAEAQALLQHAPATLNFTPRQLQLIKLMCDGLSSKEIGEKLNLKPASIEDYRKTLLRKSNCNNTGELIAFALKNGIL